MDGLMNWQRLEERSRRANQPPGRRSAPADPVATAPLGPRGVLVGVGGSRRGGRCCPDQQLRLQPCYPYSADWRPRCHGCGRWCSQPGAHPDHSSDLAPAAERAGWLPLSA